MLGCAVTDNLITVLIKSGTTALVYKEKGNVWIQKQRRTYFTSCVQFNESLSDFTAPSEDLSYLTNVKTVFSQ